MLADHVILMKQLNNYHTIYLYYTTAHEVYGAMVVAI